MYSSADPVSTIRRVSEDTPPATGALALSRAELPPGAPAAVRRERLAELFHEARACTRCPQLVAGRTQVVFGAGNADAELMFIGEAPGAREDEQGVPFVGASGKLLDELLASIGLERADVFVANVLKCRPPGNRDPAPAEIARCRPYLYDQIALIEPRVVCTLGNFATKLLRDDPAGIKEVRGQSEVITLGRRRVHLLPLYHPAAALYTRALRATLEEDIAKLPELLSRPAPAQPVIEDRPLEDSPSEVEGDAADEAAAPAPEATTPESTTPEPAVEPPDQPQLGLF